MILVLYSFFSKEIADDALFNALVRSIPETMQEQVFKYKRIEDRKACLIGKLLIQRGLTYFELNRSCFLNDMAYTPNNRPFFRDIALDFNVSHSEECVICAMSPSCRLGIDIEHIHPIKLIDFADYLNAEEWAIINSTDHPIRNFYRCWTRKESALKADGKGLNYPLVNVSTVGNDVRIDDSKWFLREVSVAEDYACSLATDSNGKSLTLNLVQEKIFLDTRDAS